MKALVIGAHGFIGSHLVNYFERLGCELYTCSTRISSNKNSFLIPEKHASFDPIFKNHHFDICFNASGASSVGQSVTQPSFDKFLNVTLTENILKSLSKYSTNTKFVHFSSAAVYGQKNIDPIHESEPTYPYSPYGQHKLEMEQLSHNYDLPIVNIRAFSVYGPKLKKQLFWDLYKHSDQTSIQLFGTGSETRDYIYIDDFLTAIKLIAEHASFNKEAINVGNGLAISTKEASKTFLTLLNFEGQCSFNDQQRRGDPDHYCADNSTLLSLGYQQNTSLEQGLTYYKEWLERI